MINNNEYRINTMNQIDNYLKDLNEKLDCVKALIRYIELPQKKVEIIDHRKLNSETNEYEDYPYSYVSYTPSKSKVQDNIRIARSLLQDISNSINDVSFYISPIEGDIIKTEGVN